MTYRVRCKRAARTRSMRPRKRSTVATLAGFDAMLKEYFGSKGKYEAPSAGFTPNENWKPRYTPGIEDSLYAPSPWVAMLPKRAGQ